MAQYVPDETRFADLNGKVVVLTGGATGIGAATVKLLSKHGARVVLGDVNDDAAQQLVAEVSGATFCHCDVSKYDDIYELFRTAYETHGQVDHALSCAGIFEQGNWFDPDLTIESVKNDHGNVKVLDVNVMGTMVFSRIALPFLRQNLQKGKNRTLTLLSSVNAFRESPGLYLYQTSKHAIHGLLRASRKTLYERDGIRVNAVCPGMTDTPMTAGVVKPFKENGLFWQTPESVAAIILGLQTDTQLNGKAIYIEGGDGWEFEDSFFSAQPQWLGEEPTRRMRANAEAVNSGALVPK